MRRPLLAAAERLAGPAAAAPILAFAPVGRPASAVSVPLALALGAGAGTALFAVLARRARVPPLGRAGVGRAVALAAPLVVVAAAAEEVVWRFGLLGALRPLAGTIGAALATSILFALAHGRQGARALAAHTATGTCFAAVYLTAGSLAAAIAAHAVYNLWVVAASTAWPEPARAPA